MGNIELTHPTALRRFRSPGRRELFYFSEAALALGLASLAILLLPFRVVVRTLHLGTWTAGRRLSPGASVAAEVALAVNRASRRMPWRTVCFDEALATHWMLRRRGISSTFHYGIRQEGEEMGAHVWVSLNDRILIGADEARNHACVAEFPLPHPE